MKRDSTRIRVSIIVITKNRAEILRPCILSIFSQQTPFTELVVVDGSTDTKTAELTRSLSPHTKTRIRYITEQKPGYAMARNRGVDAACCPWIAFTDDDCVLDRKWLSQMSQSIQKHPRAGALVGRTKTYYPTNPFALAAQFYELLWKIPAVRGDRVIDPEILDTKNVVFSARVFRGRHLRFRQEHYQEKLLSTDDIDMGMQIGAAGYTAYTSPDAIIRHKDSTGPRSFLCKLLFDRFSYTQYHKRWTGLRREYQQKRKPVTKPALFELLFAQYNTSWYLRLLTHVTIAITDAVICI